MVMTKQLGMEELSLAYNIHLTLCDTTLVMIIKILEYSIGFSV